MKDIYTRCVDLVKHLDLRFSFKGVPVGYKEVFASNGIFSIIAKRANQLCIMCLGYGIGVKFETDDTSVVGLCSVFDNVTPDVLRLAFILDVILSLIDQDSRDIVLDDLLYD